LGGAFDAGVEGGCLIDCQPFAHDPDPSPMLLSIPDAVHHPNARRCRLILDAERLRPRPHSDTAIMLALTLVIEELHDADFLARYCVGFERFRDYLMGRDDGIAKDADWAARLSEIPADTIRDLARRMARDRNFITVNWSLQRAAFRAVVSDSVMAAWRVSRVSAYAVLADGPQSGA